MSAERKECEEYLAKHDIEPAVNEVINYCLHEKPGDPYIMLSDLLREKSNVAGVINKLELYPVYSNEHTNRIMIIAHTASEHEKSMIDLDEEVDERELEVLCKSLPSTDISDQKLIDKKIGQWAGDSSVKAKIAFGVSWCCYKLNCRVQRFPLCGQNEVIIPRIVSKIYTVTQTPLVKCLNVYVAGAESLMEEVNLLASLEKNFGELIDKRPVVKKPNLSALDNACACMIEITNTIAEAVATLKDSISNHVEFRLSVEFHKLCKTNPNEERDPGLPHEPIYRLKSSDNEFTNLEWTENVRKIVQIVQSCCEEPLKLRWLINPVGITDTTGLAFLEEGSSDAHRTNEEYHWEGPDVPKVKDLKMVFSLKFSKKEDFESIIDEGDIQNVMLNEDVFTTMTDFMKHVGKLKEEEIFMTYDLRHGRIVDEDFVNAVVAAECEEIVLDGICSERSCSMVNELMKIEREGHGKFIVNKDSDSAC